MNMTDNAQQFYQYFRDCYKLDYREFNVDNVLSSKYKYKWFVSDVEELFNDHLPYIPYSHDKLADLQKDIELYKLEKRLFYACFFVLTESDNPLVKDKRVCAPLFLFPANILEIDDLTYLEIEEDNLVINRSVLSKLDLVDESKGKELFIEEFKAGIEKHSGNYVWIKTLVDKYFTNIDSEELLLNPRVWNAAKLRAYYKQNDAKTEMLKVVPAACTLLVEKSSSSLKVLNDLEMMSKQDEFNTSLSELFGDDAHKSTYDFSFLQSRLNMEQHKGLVNAQAYNSSVLIGPPGTGKSYTISAIVADAVVNGQSVLVVSKTKQAVEVIRTMLDKDYRMKDYLIHTTGNKHKLSLMSKIQKYLSGIQGIPNKNFQADILTSKYSSLKESETRFKEFVSQELRLSDLEFEEGFHLFRKFQKAFIRFSMGNGEKLWDLFQDIEVQNKKLDVEIRYFCKRKIEKNIHTNASKYRKDVALYYDALDASSFTESKQLAAQLNYQNILKVFPVWLANLSDLNSIVPLQKDLFDLVIIDEATQCDIASALPAIFRAKRVVISGDPNQLRHYSFVSHAQQSNLLKKYQLPTDKIFDYRNRSILDFYLAKVSDQDQVTFLREHFRSTPSLIEFSNQHFYDGQLEVLKSTPKHTGSSQIELIQVDGVRDKKGVNEKEAKAVLKKLEQLMKKYQDEKVIPSIGVISLFSSQVNYLNRQIRERFDLKLIKKFDLMCGTPYNFQGSEREIVLISFAVCDQTHHSAFIHANKPEVLNVAITRAKSFQYIFKSVSNQKVPKDSLLASYFSFIRDFTHQNEDEIEVDAFQQDVVEALNKSGYKNIQCAYPVGGCLLDILVEYNKQYYFIDLIGYPGVFKEAFSLERYKTLSRMNIQSIPLHYSYWKNSKAKALNKLQRLLN